MGRRTQMIAVAVTVAGCGAHQRYAPPGNTGSWLVAVNPVGWYQPHGSTGGLGWEVVTYKAVAPHVLVGGRAAALPELQIDLFGEDTSEPDHHLDIGPVVGTAASLSRMSASLSAGPLLTHVKHE